MGVPTTNPVSWLLVQMGCAGMSLPWGNSWADMGLLSSTTWLSHTEMRERTMKFKADAKTSAEEDFKDWDVEETAKQDAAIVQLIKNEVQKALEDAAKAKDA